MSEKRKPGIIASDGRVLFEFDSDGQMAAILCNIICQAKFGRELRSDHLLNGYHNALIDALGALLPKRTPRPDAAFTYSNCDGLLTDVQALILAQAPHLNWEGLSRTQKLKLLTEAMHPNKVREDVAGDIVDFVDGRITQFAEIRRHASSADHE